MKNKLLIILLLICNQSFSQYSFNYYFPTYKEIKVIETEDNNFAVFLGDSLFFFSPGGNIIEKRKIHDNNHSVFNIFKLQDGNYLSSGIYDCTGNNNYKLWLKKYDSDFNTIWEKIHDIDIKNKTIFYTWNTIENYNKDIIIALDSDSAILDQIPDTAYLYKFSNTGDLISSRNFSHYLTLKGGKIVQIPDTSGYLFANFWDAVMPDGADCIFKLDNNFNIDTIFNTYSSDYLEYQTKPNLKFISDSTFIYAGACYFNSSAISLYDTSFNEHKNIIFETGGVHDFNEVADNQALDFSDTSAIFFSFIQPGLHYWPPQEPNFSVIVKVNSNLDIQWEKFYGDSITESFDIRDIYATKDGGCIITGIMQFAPFTGYNLKPFIVKIDAEGNLPNLPASIYESIITAYNLILYPNPGKDFLNIRTAVQSIGGTFSTFDISGKQILSQTINRANTCINTANLPSGIYVYRYTLNNKIIETGKWVKQ